MVIRKRIKPLDKAKECFKSSTDPDGFEVRVINDYIGKSVHVACLK